MNEVWLGGNELILNMKFICLLEILVLNVMWHNYK